MEDDIIGKIISGSLSKIPIAGSIMSNIFDLIWSSVSSGGSQDFQKEYQQILDQLEAYVDQQIINEIVDQYKGQMHVMGKNVSDYDATKNYNSLDDAYQNANMAATLVGIGILKEDSPDSEKLKFARLLPYSATLIPTHLALMRQRIAYWKTQKNEAEIAQCTKNLHDQIAAYKSFIHIAYPYLLGWRYRQLSYETGSSYVSHGTTQYWINIKDAYNDNHLEVTGYDDEWGDTFSHVSAQIAGHWQNEFLDHIIPYFFLDSYTVEGGGMVAKDPMLGTKNELGVIAIYPVYGFGSYLECSPNIGQHLMGGPLADPVWTDVKYDFKYRITDFQCNLDGAGILTGLTLAVDNGQSYVYGFSESQAPGHSSVSLKGKKIAKLKFHWSDRNLFADANYIRIFGLQLDFQDGSTYKSEANRCPDNNPYMSEFTVPKIYQSTLINTNKNPAIEWFAMYFTLNADWYVQQVSK